MHSRIVAIKPINGHRMKITLQLTTACTYSCRYCPDRLNKGSHGEFDLARAAIKQAVEQTNSYWSET
jgi:MoaA/NifB/PqqE/SkfB family radical SAM enzyme